MRRVILTLLFVCTITGFYLWYTNHNNNNFHHSFVMYEPFYTEEGQPREIAAILVFTKGGDFFYHRINKDNNPFFNFRRYEQGIYKKTVTAIGGGYSGEIIFFPEIQGKNIPVKTKFNAANFGITFFETNSSKEYTFTDAKSLSKL